MNFNWAKSLQSDAFPVTNYLNARLAVHMNYGEHYGKPVVSSNITGPYTRSTCNETYRSVNINLQ